MPGVGRASCLLGIRGGAGMTGREVDGDATASVVSEFDRTRQRLFILVQVRGPSGISGSRKSNNFQQCHMTRMSIWKVFNKKGVSGNCTYIFTCRLPY